MKKLKSKQLTAGFTLIETLIIAIIIGVLAAIAGPSWVRFINQQRVNATNDALLRAIQNTQREAKSRKLDYSISFKTENQVPKFAIHVDNTTPTSSNWQSLTQDLNIKPGQVILGTNLSSENHATTSLPYASATDQTITFDYRGILKPNNPKPNLSNKGFIITVAMPQASNPLLPIALTRRCVKVRTLLGALQTAYEDGCNAQ